MFGILDYIMSLAERSTDLPLRHLKHWRPIKIDALGLVTLLGADDVNKSIGTLQRRRFTECLPLLAAFVIAGDSFTEEQPGYALYNITDGIYTTELKGWFTRWLSAQHVLSGTTVFRWSVVDRSSNFREFQLLAWVIAFLAVAPLLVCTCLIGDWYGVGNSLAIILSIFVRKSLLWQLREGLNSVAAPERTKPDEPDRLPLHRETSEKSQSSVSTFTRQLHRKVSEPHSKDLVTIFVTRADGKMVTIKAPRTVLKTFIKDVPLPSETWYHTLRWIGWSAFGAHIIVLGMASLFTQIYTVVLLVFSTWALCHDFDIDSGRQHIKNGICSDNISAQIITTPFTSRVVVTQEDPTAPEDPDAAVVWQTLPKALQDPEVTEIGEIADRRMLAYVRARPTPKQEKMLQHWSMMPFKGVPWYTQYKAAKTAYGAGTAVGPLEESPQESPQETPQGSPRSDGSRSSTLQGDSQP